MGTKISLLRIVHVFLELFVCRHDAYPKVSAAFEFPLQFMWVKVAVETAG